MKAFHYTSISRLEKILEEKKLQTPHQAAAQLIEERGVTPNPFMQAINTLTRINAIRRKMFEKGKLDAIDYAVFLSNVQTEAKKDETLRPHIQELAKLWFGDPKEVQRCFSVFFYMNEKQARHSAIVEGNAQIIELDCDEKDFEEPLNLNDGIRTHVSVSGLDIRQKLGAIHAKAEDIGRVKQLLKKHGWKGVEVKSY